MVRWWEVAGGGGRWWAGWRGGMAGGVGRDSGRRWEAVGGGGRRWEAVGGGGRWRHLDRHVGEVAERAARRLEVTTLLDGRDETLSARLVDAAVFARCGHVEPELDEHLVLGQRGVVVGHLDDRIALLRVGLGHVVERHLEGRLGAWRWGQGLRATTGGGGRGGRGGGKDGGRWWERWREVVGGGGRRQLGEAVGSFGSRPVLLSLRRAAQSCPEPLRAAQSLLEPPRATPAGQETRRRRRRRRRWCGGGGVVAVATAVWRQRCGCAFDVRMPPIRKVSVVASMDASPQFHLCIRSAMCGA